MYYFVGFFKPHPMYDQIQGYGIVFSLFYK
jgi:hypothetical protein